MFGIATMLKRRAARKRAIFHFHDGNKFRWVDPLVVETALEAHTGENWQDVVVLVRNLNRPAPPGLSGTVANDRKEARRRETAKLLGMIRAAFGIGVLTADGKGLTEVETVGVLTDYLNFIEGLATAARPLAESPPPSEASPAD